MSYQPYWTVREAVQNILRGGVYEIGDLRPLDAYPPPIFSRNLVHSPHFSLPPNTPPPIFERTEVDPPQIKGGLSARVAFNTI